MHGSGTPVTRPQNQLGRSRIGALKPAGFPWARVVTPVLKGNVSHHAKRVIGDAGHGVQWLGSRRRTATILRRGEAIPGYVRCVGFPFPSASSATSVDTLLWLRLCRDGQLWFGLSGRMMGVRVG
jgi:hypothetical protein